MRISDSNHWIISEIRDSKIFTALNIISVAVNVFLVLVFLALITGFEAEYISRITRNYNLFTLGVAQRNSARLNAADLQSFAGDTSVRQIVPVLTRYIELHNGAQVVRPVWSESFWTGDARGTDLRSEDLTYVAGGPIQSGDIEGVIITQAAYNTLFDGRPLNTVLSASEPLTMTVVVSVEQSGKTTDRTFQAKVRGVVDSTLYGGRLAYIALPLAQKIDEWANQTLGRAPSLQSGDYDRVDVVVTDLDSLKRLRTQIERKGLSTTSILDEIDSVSVILRAIQIGVLGIVAISSVIAFFNLAITLASYVMKRRQEIGVLKAMGATDGQVQRIFLLHAIYLCLLGCVVGMCVAIVVLWALQVTVLPGLHVEQVRAFQVQWNHVLITLLVAVISSVASVLLPARRASAISPAEIMRSA